VYADAGGRSSPGGCRAGRTTRSRTTGTRTSSGSSWTAAWTRRPTARSPPQHYQLEAQKRAAGGGGVGPGHPHHHQVPQQGVISNSPEAACSRSSDDEPPTPRRHLDIDLNLPISLAAYQPPEETSIIKPLMKQDEAAGAAAGGTNAAAVCLCLNSLGYQPSVECVCGSVGGSSQQWARSFLQAAPCYRGQ